MEHDAISELEYEAMVFSRHLSGLPNRSRRNRGVLDQSAYVLLTLLRTAGPLSIRELTEMTGLDASTLNRQTAALVRGGFAERIPDPAGGIARKFTATAQGTRELLEERDASRTALESLTAEWSDGDREALAGLLGRLNREIEARSGREWPRPQTPGH